MRQIWKVRGELTVGSKYHVEFLSLYENEYDRDPMCDCVGKLMVPTGDYKVVVRNRNESDAATPVLVVDTTRRFGNQMFRTIRDIGSREELMDNYIAYITYNIFKHGKDFFKMYQDKYSGYYDGAVESKTDVEEMKKIITEYPIRK